MCGHEASNPCQAGGLMISGSSFVISLTVHVHYIISLSEGLGLGNAWRDTCNSVYGFDYVISIGLGP